jgi:hypothetical protein
MSMCEIIAIQRTVRSSNQLQSCCRSYRLLQCSVFYPFYSPSISPSTSNYLYHSRLLPLSLPSTASLTLPPILPFPLTLSPSYFPSLTTFLSLLLSLFHSLQRYQGLRVILPEVGYARFPAATSAWRAKCLFVSWCFWSDFLVEERWRR